MSLDQIRYKAGKIVRSFINTDFCETGLTISGHRLSYLQFDVLFSDKWEKTPLDLDDANQVLKTQSYLCGSYQHQTHLPEEERDIIAVPAALQTFTNNAKEEIYLSKIQGQDDSLKNPADSVIDLSVKMITLASKTFEKAYGYKPAAGLYGTILDENGNIPGTKTYGTPKLKIQPQ